MSDLFHLSFVTEKHNGDGPLKDLESSVGSRLYTLPLSHSKSPQSAYRMHFRVSYDKKKKIILLHTESNELFYNGEAVNQLRRKN